MRFWKAHPGGRTWAQFAHAPRSVLVLGLARRVRDAGRDVILTPSVTRKGKACVRACMRR